MCVIAYKAKDVRFPSRRNLREMWEHNPDGAGVMWRDEDGLVRWKKGFMSFRRLKKWVNRNRDWLENVECALHFRITTHGGTSEGNCHPFAVDGGDPHRLEGSARRVLMHNGILPLNPRATDVSDSGELALRLSRCEVPRKSMETLNECLSGNRILLMDEDGTHFFGDAFRKSENKENEGILYSNLHWEFRPSAYRSVGLGSSFSFAKPSPSGAKGRNLVWDSCSRVWRDADSGEAFDEWNVDLDSVDDAEYRAYQDYKFAEMEEVRREFNLSEDDVEEAYVDAEYCGMTLREYVMSCFEYESAKPAMAVA